MITGIVPARAGSKGIPHKNVRLMAGEPLVTHVLRNAVLCNRLDRVVVATDDPAVEGLVARFAHPSVVSFRRSASSSIDEASTEEVMQEVLRELPNIEVLVLLQATSPLTTSVDIDGTIALVTDGGYDSALTVAPSKRFLWVEDERGWIPVNYDYKSRPRRQAFDDPFYVENGAVYATRTAAFAESGSRISGRIGAFVMHSSTYHEIDTVADWHIVESEILRRQVPEPARDVPHLLIVDVDGVLTDSGMYYGEGGEELKKFNTRDGKAFELCRSLGIKTAILTSEDSHAVRRRGEKLGVDACVTASTNKLADAARLSASLSIDMADIAFIGDDVNDLALLREVGWSFCPSDAVEIVRRSVSCVCRKAGGAGVVREVVDMWMRI